MVPMEMQSNIRSNPEGNRLPVERHLGKCTGQLSLQTGTNSWFKTHLGTPLGRTAPPMTLPRHFMQWEKHLCTLRHGEHNRTGVPSYCSQQGSLCFR